LTISGYVNHASMADPGDGGRRIIDTSDGREILVVGTQFYRATLNEAGTASRAPIVYRSSPGLVINGLKGYPGYAGIARGNAIASDPGVHLTLACETSESRPSRGARRNRHKDDECRAGVY
jgi:hypothetical protein